MNPFRTNGTTQMGPNGWKVWRCPMGAAAIVGADGQPIVLRAVNYLIACEFSDPNQWIRRHLYQHGELTYQLPRLGMMVCNGAGEGHVHHRRFPAIAQNLRAMYAGLTLVMYTRCPYFLDTANIETDQVIVLIDNQPHEIDRERLKLFTDDFTLGEIWHNEGERELVRRNT